LYGGGFVVIELTESITSAMCIKGFQVWKLHTEYAKCVQIWKLQCGCEQIVLAWKLPVAMTK